MATPWNLTPGEWSHVLLDGLKPDTLASRLTQGLSVPWTEVLLKSTSDSKRVLDLGSGQGENSGLLALNGREMTLLDWSKDNLDFSTQLFGALGVTGQFCHADMTQPLPFKNDAFDVVFSCGVFEYFNERQIELILQEAFRISKKRVIIMVPNAWSLAYRLGMWYMKRTGKWHWGGEVPSYTLKRCFKQVGSVRVNEFSVAAKHSLNFLTMPMGEQVKTWLTRVLKLTDDSKPSLLRQGYLLITIGDKQPE